MGPGRVVTTRAQYTDEQLALAAQTGDQAAVAELVDRFEPMAAFLARKFRTHLSDGDDVMQEALIAIVRAARTWRPDRGSTVRSLTALAIRRAIYTRITLDNTMGRRAAQHPLSINAPLDLDDRDDATLESAVADPFAVQPHDALERKEQLQTLVDLVNNGMSAIEREALIRFLNGQPFVEIEDVLERLTGRTSSCFWPDGRRRAKITENALQRARDKLRVALEEPRPLGAAA